MKKKRDRGERLSQQMKSSSCFSLILYHEFFCWLLKNFYVYFIFLFLKQKEKVYLPWYNMREKQLLVARGKAEPHVIDTWPRKLKEEGIYTWHTFSLKLHNLCYSHKSMSDLISNVTLCKIQKDEGTRIDF